MPTVPRKSIRSVSKHPRSIALMGDNLVERLLRVPDLNNRVPELAAAARQLKAVNRLPTTGCRSCGRNRAKRKALAAAKQRISTMPPEKLAKLKRVLGLPGHAKIRVFIKKGNRIVPLDV